MPYSDLDEEYAKRSAKLAWGVILAGAGLALALFLCASCTYADKDRVVFVGGKGAYKSKSFALTTDNEKSFSDATMLGAIAIPAAQAVALGKSADRLSAIQHTNNTKLGIVTANNHTAEVLGAQKAGVESLKATTLPK